MPITFSQINNLPDPLPNNRHELRFPSIGSSDGYALTLRHGHVTFPAAQVAQIIVKILGHSVAFAGGLSHENTMTVSFIEDSQGTVLQALIAWMQIARNRETGAGGTKAEYAANGELYMHDTKGGKVHTFILYNMWPVTITYPDMVEESGPAEVEVTFSVDAVDLKAGTAATESSSATVGEFGQHETGRTSSKGSGANFAYPSPDPASIDFGKSISNISIDGSNFAVRRALQIGNYALGASVDVIPQTAFTVAKFAQQFGSLFR